MSHSRKLKLTSDWKDKKQNVCNSSRRDERLTPKTFSLKINLIYAEHTQLKVMYSSVKCERDKQKSKLFQY